jgi:hypothetical protein
MSIEMSDVGKENFDAQETGPWDLVHEHIEDVSSALHAALHAVDTEVNPDKV